MKVEEMEREKCLSWESKKKKKRESFYVRMVSEHNQCNVCVSVRNKDGSAGHFFIAHNPVGVGGWYRAEHHGTRSSRVPRDQTAHFHFRTHLT